MTLEQLGEAEQNAKLRYEMLGMMNTPSDPVERAKLHLEYESAYVAWSKARSALLDALRVENTK